MLRPMIRDYQGNSSYWDASNAFFKHLSFMDGALKHSTSGQSSLLLFGFSQALKTEKREAGEGMSSE